MCRACWDVQSLLAQDEQWCGVPTSNLTCLSRLHVQESPQGEGEGNGHREQTQQQAEQQQRQAEQSAPHGKEKLLAQKQQVWGDKQAPGLHACV